MVLQDAVILLHEGKKNLLFSLFVFATQLFRTYQAALVDKVMVEAGGGDTSIKQSIDMALPGVCN